MCNLFSRKFWHEREVVKQKLQGRNRAKVGFLQMYILFMLVEKRGFKYRGKEECLKEQIIMRQCGIKTIRKGLFLRSILR